MGESERRKFGGFFSARNSRRLWEAWHKLVPEHRPWGECAGDTHTTVGAERAIAIAAFYALRHLPPTTCGLLPG